MSKSDLDHVETQGFFLPEDSYYRLEQLRDHTEFLADLAQPRSADEEDNWTGPQIRGSEVAICLKLLAEQVEIVLDKISCPGFRHESQAAQSVDANPNARQEAPDAIGETYLFGVTLDQFDRIDRLLDSLRVLGNVVTCSDHAELSDVTLSIMGDAIYRDVDALRDIIHDLDSMQRLDEPHGTKPGVCEEQASYLALPLHVPMGKVSPVVRQLPTYH